MGGNLEKRIDRIRSKAELLTQQYARLRQSKEEADLRIDELLAIVDSQRKEIARLRQQVEYLKVASTLAPDHNDVERSRAILAELVREIDKCISELND